MSSQVTAAKKPEVKRPSLHKGTGMGGEVPTMKNFRKKKPKPESKKPEWPRRARLEVLLIKPAEGVSCASNLTNWMPQSR